MKRALGAATLATAAWLGARDAAAAVDEARLLEIAPRPADARPTDPIRALVAVPPSSVPLDYAPADFVLVVDPSSGKPLRVPASAARPYTKGDGPPLSVMVLVQGTQAFLGPDDAALAGAPAPSQVREAIRLAIGEIAGAGPSGSRIGIMTYGASATLRFALHPPEQLVAEALGGPDEYRNAQHALLAEGLSEAVRILGREQGPHALVIIGDGSATDLAGYETALERLRVSVYAVTYDPAGGERKRGFSAFDRFGGVFAAQDLDGLRAAGRRVRAALDAAHWVEFPAAKLPADGTPHPISVLVQEQTAATFTDAGETIALTRRAAPTRGWRWAWIAVLAVAGVGILYMAARLLAGGSSAARQRGQTLPIEPAPEPPADPIDPPRPIDPGPPPPAPEPPAERETIKIDDQPHLETEVVAPGLAAWFVPLTGGKRFQTFPLPRGGTYLIGNAVGCNLRLEDDPQVSGHHAKVVIRAGRYTLIDTDSRNGTHFMSEPVREKELIDNDTIVVGKTELKFKSTASNIDRP